MMKKSKDEIKKKNDKETRTMNFLRNKFRRNKKAEREKVDGKCLESATTIMRRWKDVAANFEKQAIRFEKKIHASIKKLQKKGAFEPIAKKLIEIGGGNKTGLTCAGSSTSAGAEQLTNITTTLMECENEINATCSFYNLRKELNITTMIHVGFCGWFTGNLTEESQKCLGLSKEVTASDACACWTSEKITSLSNKVQECKFSGLAEIADEKRSKKLYCCLFQM